MYSGIRTEWYAIYVKARHEKNVALTLKGKEVEAFLPTYPATHKNRKTFDLPLFPNYVFCRMHLDNALSVITTPGVFSIIGTGRAPAPIPEEEIDGLRFMLTSGWRAYPWPYVSVGQEIQIESGPLRGLKGSVAASSNSKWLVISIHLLQRAVAVKVDRESLPFGAVSSCSPVVCDGASQMETKTSSKASYLLTGRALRS